VQSPDLFLGAVYMRETEGNGKTNNDIWVVTVNWNQPKLTYECIHSLRENNFREFSLVIVDNGSTDNSLEYLNMIAEKELIATSENLGFAGGFNIGLKYAMSKGADYIFMVNNDAISQPKMLDNLIDTAEQLEAGIAAPAIYYLDSPDQIWSTGGKIIALLSAPIDGHSRKIPLPKEPVRRDFLTGCALLIHNSVFEKIGFFDEGFFLYYEDLDFFMRAKKAGISVWLVPDAKLLHHVSASIVENKSEIFYYWMGYSSWRYFSKHLKLWQWFFVIPWRLTHLFKMILKLLFSGRFVLINTFLKGNADYFLKR
jgi:GT2 family glycosyltransferase